MRKRDIRPSRAASRRAKPAGGRRNLFSAADFSDIVLDNIHEEISIVDRDQNIVYVNRLFAQRVGRRVSELVGRKCYQVLRARETPCDHCVCIHSFKAPPVSAGPPGPDGAGPDCHRAIALATGTPIELCHWEDGPEGRRFYERRTFPLLNEKGEVAWAIHCTRDVTEQRRMEHALRRQRERLGRMLREVRRVRQQNDALNAQLMQAEKLASLGKMASITAHELDSPLSTILGYAEMLKPSAPDAEALRHLGLISQQAARCHEIIRRTLAFARQPQPTLAPVDLNEIVQQVVMLLEHSFRLRHVAVVRDLFDPLPAVRGDGHALTQLCFNLLRNALDAVQDDGEVRIRTAPRPGGRHIVLEVEDNGHGLPTENVERIFEPFFTTKPPGEGTGLGLAICQSIVHAHGGHIHAENRPSGGARFSVELPTVDTAPPGPPRDSSA